jgi:hypothetical protein
MKQPRAEKPVGRAALADVEVVVAGTVDEVVGTAAAEVVEEVVGAGATAESVLVVTAAAEVVVVFAATVPMSFAPKILLFGLAAPMEFFM